MANGISKTDLAWVLNSVSISNRVYEHKEKSGHLAGFFKKKHRILLDNSMVRVIISLLSV